MKNEKIKEKLAEAKTWVKDHKKLVTRLAVATGAGVVMIILGRSKDNSSSCDIAYVNAEDLCTAYGIKYDTPDEAGRKALHMYTWSRDFLSSVFSRAGMEMTTTSPEIKRIQFYTDTD